MQSRSGSSTPGQPHVAILTLGGTIAMTTSPGGAITPALAAADILAAIPGLAAMQVTLSLHDVRQLPSASLGYTDLLAVLDLITQHEGDWDGVVLMQGTDTIEETSWFLDLLYDADAPIVVTGAMRGADHAGADGPANVLAAIQIAAHPDSRGRGVLVGMAGHIHTPRQVRKVHTTNIAAFASPATGTVGYVDEGVPTFWSSPRRASSDLPLHVRSAARASQRWAELSVPILTMGVGVDATLVRATSTLVRDSAVQAAVIAGVGAAHAPAGIVPDLAELAELAPTVLVSRIGVGAATRNTYGYAGSEVDLHARGLIPGGYLDSLKARLALVVLAAADIPREQYSPLVQQLGR